MQRKHCIKGNAMAIDIHNEHLLTFAKASHVFSNIEGFHSNTDDERRKGPHASSFWRWARKGLRGVKLDYVRIGHRLVTSREALDRFANALAAADSVQFTTEAPIAL